MSLLIRPHRPETGSAAAAPAPALPFARLLERFGQELWLLGVAALLLVWGAALWSFSLGDPAWSTSGVRETPLNWLGAPGAWLADLSLYLLGRSVWVLYAALALAWLRLSRSWARRPTAEGSTGARSSAFSPAWWLALGALLLACTTLEHTRLYAGYASLPYDAGGVAGHFAGRLAVALLGFTGSGVAAIALGLWAVARVAGFAWAEVAQTLGERMEAWLLAARKRRERAADVAAGQQAARERGSAVEHDLEQAQQHPPLAVLGADAPPAPAAPAQRAARERQTPLFADMPESHLPAIDLLDPPPAGQGGVPHDTLEMTSRLIEKKLRDFGVSVHVVAAMPGPVITRYEIEPATGVKGSQIVNLAKDLARSLSLVSIRVIETIPGKNLMALELPNARRQTIGLGEVLDSATYHQAKSLLTVALGKDIVGHPVVADLAKMPHVLVAGTTGSGKSVGINAMILSLLYKATPEEVRLLMIDPKMLEMSVYEGIAHLIAPVVTDMRQAAHALNWCVGEMERRYRLMSKLGVRNLLGYNARIHEAAARSQPIPNPFSLTPEAPEPLERLPHIVVVIDELADLMMVVGKKIEELIARLAQKARAAGIHLILATQRPSVDVITGLIKANIPTRIAFQVSSKIDSRTILDQMGAESLLGLGDMLYLPAGHGLPTRVHGAFVSDDEVHRVVAFLKAQGPANYIEGVLEGGSIDGEDAAASAWGGAGGESDPLYDQAVEVVLRHRKASISLVQRELRIGYNRSARLLADMESAGLIGSLSASGQREILRNNQDPGD